MPITLTRMKSVIDSNRLHLEKLRKGIIAQSTTPGAMTIVPAASASHQVTQVTTESEEVSLFAKMNPARAMAELITAVGAKEMIANFAMPAGVSNVLRPFDQRLINHVPANTPRRVPIPTEPNSKGDRPAIT